MPARKKYPDDWNVPASVDKVSTRWGTDQTRHLWRARPPRVRRNLCAPDQALTSATFLVRDVFWELNQISQLFCGVGL